MTFQKERREDLECLMKYLVVRKNMKFLNSLSKIVIKNMNLLFMMMHNLGLKKNLLRK